MQEFTLRRSSKLKFKIIHCSKMFNTAKTASLFIIFALSLISGVASLVGVKCLLGKLGESDKFKKAIGILNCFSGGVFLATSILDLLPEARESMEHAKEHYNVDTEYPFTELLLGVGFLLILTIEHMAHTCCSSKKVDIEIMTPKHNSKPSNSPKQQLGAKENATFSDSIKSTGNSHVTDENAILVHQDFEDTSYVDDITYQNYGTVDASIDKTLTKPYNEIVSRASTPYDTVVFGDSDKIIIRRPVGNVHQMKPSLRKALEEPEEIAALSKIRGMTLMFALSLHMVFDGLALGLLQKENKIWQLLAALSLHKVLVFMTVSLQALEILKCTKKTILVLVVFALVSPFGIVIGEGINNTGDEVSQDTASAVLQGIATGTFLFVTFFEIMLKELGFDHHNLLKVSVTIVGFALVACVRILEHDEGE